MLTRLMDTFTRVVWDIDSSVYFIHQLQQLGREMSSSVTGTHLAINIFKPNGDKKDIPVTWNGVIRRLDNSMAHMRNHIAANESAYAPVLPIYKKIDKRARSLIDSWDENALRRTVLTVNIDPFDVRGGVERIMLPTVHKFVVLDGMLCAQLRSREHRIATRIALKPVSEISSRSTEGRTWTL